MRRIAVLSTVFALSACATAPVLHDEAQLNDIGARCGLALGELIQDESEKRLLLVIRSETSAEQRGCLAQWARANHLKAVFVNVQFRAG